MEHLAQRCATVTAAVLTVGGLVTALTSMTQPPPELQVRDFDLTAARNVDTSPLVETMENHVRPDLSGTGDTQDGNLADVLLGRSDGDFGIGSTSTGDLSFDEEMANVLAAGGLDPAILQGAGLAFEPIDVSAMDGVVPPVGAFGATGQEAGSAAASAFSGIAVVLQGLPAAYETFTTAVAAMEADVNSALVTAQMEAAEQLFSDDPAVNDVVNWIFTINNTVLAQNQGMLNNLLGIPFDSQDSLLGHLDPGLADADWSILLGLTPEDFTEIVNAIQSDNLSLLGSIDWAEMFSTLF